MIFPFDISSHIVGKSLLCSIDSWSAEAVLAASEAYLAEEDIIGQFIEDCLERLPEHSGQFTPMDELNTEFEWWCGHNGHPIWSKRSFKKALKEREFKEGRQSSARGFDDLRIKMRLTLWQKWQSLPYPPYYHCMRQIPHTSDKGGFVISVIGDGNIV